MSFPTAKKFRSRIRRRVQSNIEESISNALENWEDPEHTSAVIKFQRRETALCAVQLLESKGYISNTVYRNGCVHVSNDCDDCGYDSDYDNQACMHYLGECSCPKWWDVIITLPDNQSCDESGDESGDQSN